MIIHSFLFYLIYNESFLGMGLFKDFFKEQIHLIKNGETMNQNEKASNNTTDFNIKTLPTKIQNNILYIICLLFTVSGFCNYGMTYFLMAIPFIILLFIRTYFKGMHNVLILMFFIFIGFIFNITLTRNPLFFPVLMGNVSVIEDGYMITTEYSDFNWYCPKSDINYCFEKNHKIVATVKKGEILEVEEIRPLGGMESIRTYNLVTTKGVFLQNSLETKKINTDFIIENPITKHLGFLMYYPIIVMELFV